VVKGAAALLAGCRALERADTVAGIRELACRAHQAAY